MSASVWSPGTTPMASVNGAMKKQVFDATAAQVLFTLTAFAYEVGSESLLVFQNGNLLAPSDYVETSTSSFTLATGATIHDEVVAVGFTEIVGEIPVVDITASSIGASKFVRVNAGATAFEGRTAAQVLSDVAAEPADATILKDADIGSTVQAWDTQLDELAAISPAQGDIIYHNGTDWVKLAAGTSGQFLKTLGAAANPLWATPSSSVVVQAVEATPVTALTTCATAIPNDDTIPQNTEGNEVITVTITPTNAANRLRIEYDSGINGLAANGYIATALFQDATVNALAASLEYTNTAVNACKLIHEMAAGTTAATTFKIRVGSAAGTVYVNGYAAARLFGGVAAARLRVTEIAV